MHYLPTGTCIPFEKKVFITASGKILPCEKISHEHFIGNVDENGVHLNTNNITGMYNRLFDDLVKRCNNCSNKLNCPQCALQIENYKCDKFLSKNEFQEYLKNNFNLMESHPEWYKEIIEEVKINE